ncbi:MAG TPA: RCC1 domain-containing protein, partial [Aquella sp.]|nr:RCC1 domain-containing protein [Aquella sp.]
MDFMGCYIYYVLVLKEYMTQIFGNHYPTEIIRLIILSVYEPIKISCGLDYTIFHHDKIYTCGNNINGKLGLGHENDVTVPEEILFPEKIKSIHCGAYHSIALTLRNP